jgi:hypothetical protein
MRAAADIFSKVSASEQSNCGRGKYFLRLKWRATSADIARYAKFSRRVCSSYAKEIAQAVRVHDGAIAGREIPVAGRNDAGARDDLCGAGVSPA